MSIDLDLSPAQRRDIATACERLSLDYSHYADTGLKDRFAELFATDGELSFFGQAFRGRAAIRAALGEGESAPSLHCVSNIRVEVLSDEAAEGTAYVTAYMKAPGAPAEITAIAPAVVGIYRDAYRLTADGWRFARRAFEPFLAAAPRG